MPFLKQQIELINEALKQTALADARFQSGRYETIAVDVSRKTTQGNNGAVTIETFPAVMSPDYEAQEITVDDTYPIIIYHKILSKKYAPDKVEFGSRNKYVTEITGMKMVMYGKYATLKLTREQLEALITANFPDVIDRSCIQPYKLDNMIVTLQGSNMNTAAVFQEEYKGIPLFLAPEDILFSINYLIETRYRKGCFEICDC